MREPLGFVTIEKSISLKLDSWFKSSNRRLQDEADAIELIKVLELGRD